MSQPSIESRDISNERAFAQAVERDSEVELADAYTLQIDIDREEDLELFRAQLSRLVEHCPTLFHELGEYDIQEGLFFAHGLKLDGVKYKSRTKGYHIILKLNEEMDVVERIMLQACLGSDRVREVLSYCRYAKGEANPVLLFRPKPAQDTSIYI